LEPNAGSVALLVTALTGSVGAVVVWHSLQLDDGATAHARFILPSLAAASFLFVAGLTALPKVVRKIGLAALVALELIVAVFSLGLLPRAFGGVSPIFGDARSAQIENATPVTFDRAMGLAGWSGFSPSNLKPGDAMRLRLFWQTSYTVPIVPLTLQDATRADVRTLRVLPPPEVLVRPDFDYSAFVRLNDGKGRVIHDQDHGPGAALGLLPHTWEAGEIIPDDWTVPIPNSAAAGEYRIEVGLYDYRDQRPILTASGQPAVVIGQVTVQ
jgi:hypothetical protein